jgi:hypothetical protein
MMVSFFSHHKCATRWLLTYLEKTANLNGLTFFHTDFVDEPCSESAQIALFGNAGYAHVSARHYRGVHVIRNPLSVVVSSYYSHLQTHPLLDSWPELTIQREILRSVSKTEGMFLTLAFVERADIAKRAIGPLLSLRQWDYDDSNYQTLRMEDLVSNPSELIAPFLSRFGQFRLPSDEEMTFSQFSSGRDPGEIDNNSHYRSGSKDDWREELPPAIVRYIRLRFSDLLERYYPESLTDAENSHMHSRNAGAGSSLDN